MRYRKIKYAAAAAAMSAVMLLGGCSGETSRKFEGSAPADSEIYVEPIAGLTDDFIRGADVSTYLSQKESGVVYKDFEGKELDDAGFFTLLADSGINCIRIRVWNDPKDENGATYGGGHNDLDTAVKIGKLATDAGIPVMIDFHYSDFWADPAKQKSPKAWAGLMFDDKLPALYDYTKESMKTLLDAGVNVTMVQVGNEINNGMAGEKARENVNKLMSRGSAAVRDAANEAGKDIKVVVHYTNAMDNELLELVNQLKTDNVDYDVLGLSFYTFWHGTADQLTDRVKEVKELTGKDVMVVETSYAYTDEDGDGNANSVSTGTGGITLDYEISVQGQANEVREVMNAVKTGGGSGVFYWEPAWIPVKKYDPNSADAAQVLESNKAAWEKYGSGWACSAAVAYDPDDAGIYYGGSAWDNQAMFDFDGDPLESLKVFKYVFGGTTAKLKIVKVNDVSVESVLGKPFTLPETAPAQMNSGRFSDIPVTWNADQTAAIDINKAGIYEIDGTANSDGTSYPVKCSLEIKKINYVKNPSLEDADMSMWRIEGNGVSRVEDNNKHTGAFSLKFWDDEPVKFTAEQTVTGVPAGKYDLGVFLQGGDADDSSVFELYVSVNGGEKLTAQSGVTSWQNWDNPIIKNIEIPEGAEVLIGVRVDAPARAWGAWDDFSLTESD